MDQVNCTCNIKPCPHDRTHVTLPMDPPGPAARRVVAYGSRCLFFGADSERPLLSLRRITVEVGSDSARENCLEMTIGRGDGLEIGKEDARIIGQAIIAMAGTL